MDSYPGETVLTNPREQIAGALRVGEWRFDLPLNEISRGGQVVRIEPRVAELLAYFARRPGRVVGREELLRNVWPGVVVGDEALSQAIRKLREALGDTSKEPAYIQTIPKRGYRMIAPVSAFGDVNAPEAETSVATATPLLGRWPKLPVRVWMAVVAAVVATAAGLWAVMTGDDIEEILKQQASASVAVESVPNVLVRRFDALADEEAQRVLARGVWQRLIADLSRNGGLRVIVGEDAGAPPGANRYQIDGTVLRVADTLRIQVILTHTASNRVVWADSYALRYPNMPFEQDAISASLLRALSINVQRSEIERQAQPYTRSIVAYQQFLDAQSAFATREHANNDRARASYLEAIKADPSFARAFGGIALTYAADATFRWANDRPAAIRNALEFAHRAEQLDPDLPEVHWTIAWVQAQRRNHAEALRHLRVALQLNPSYADAYALSASIATYVGHPEHTLPLMRAALRLRPEPGFLHFLLLGRAHFYLGDDVQAIANLHTSLQRNPEHVETHVYLAAALARSGQRDEARWELDEARALDASFRVDDWIANSLITDKAERGLLARVLSRIA